MKLNIWILLLALLIITLFGIDNWSMAENKIDKKVEKSKDLTELQKYVIFQNGTEKPFENEYWDNKREGIYVDVLSGKPLFSSTDKFDSGTGWPSFTKPIDGEAVTEKTDSSYGMERVEIRSGDSDIHLGHVFNDGPKEKGGMRFCLNSASMQFIPKENLEKEGYGEYSYLFGDVATKTSQPQTAVLAAGCFWGVEDLIAKQNGVIDVVNGYTGGYIPNPTYEIIKTGVSGHAEAVEITFDPEKISYENLLRFFFKIHDPTTLDRQGNDVGSQYRSAIFYQNSEQEKIANQLIEQANNSGKFPGDIVTKLEKLDKFYEAEDYHQDYLTKNPNGYTCHWVRDNWEF